MKRSAVISEYLEDGHLFVPLDVVKKLGLKKGTKLELSIRTITEGKEKRKRKPFSKLGVCGIWKDRQDMKNSIEWVDDIRKQWLKRGKELGIG